MATTDRSEEKDIPVDDWPEWKFLSTVQDQLLSLKRSTDEEPNEFASGLFPFVDSVLDSCGSLTMLARCSKLRDAYVVARVIYETSINAAFICTDPAPLFSRAERHAKQKSLRSLVRRIELTGKLQFESKHSAADRLMADPRHQVLLEEFTSKSGREITSWTPENVQQRLDAVYLAFGEEPTKGLAFGMLMYRHASEIAHGTLYGTLFSWGAMETRRQLKSPSDLAAFRRLETRHVLKLVCFSLESLIRVFSIAAKLPQLGDAAKNALLDYYAERKKTES